MRMYRVSFHLTVHNEDTEAYVRKYVEKSIERLLIEGETLHPVIVREIPKIPAHKEAA